MDEILQDHRDSHHYFRLEGVVRLTDKVIEELDLKFAGENASVGGT